MVDIKACYLTAIGQAGAKKNISFEEYKKEVLKCLNLIHEDNLTDELIALRMFLANEEKIMHELNCCRTFVGDVPTVQVMFDDGSFLTVYLDVRKNGWTATKMIFSRPEGSVLWIDSQPNLSSEKV